MRIGVPAETMAGETRVAATPETVKKLKALGHQVCIESGAGVAASVPDAAYEAVGGEITDAAGAWGADLVLKVRCPSEAEASRLRAGSTLVGMLNPFDAAGLQRLAALPDETVVYCAHEYSAANARFALSVDDDPALKRRTDE
ncbi:MAG: hypothetical protein ACK40S_13320, partial [Burkholderiaceae bacterium]